MNRRFFCLAMLFATTFCLAGDDLKPRLVVCTDIAPVDVEPDDMESMVRLMAYADQFEIEALITSVGHNADPYPPEWKKYLTQVIEAYRKDVPKLMRRSKQKKFLSLAKENGQQRIGYWPSADYLTERAVMGSLNGGIKAIGESNDSPGSELLIRLADENDSRPIYVAAWGGANTLAQAIWRVKQTRTADEVKNFVRKFRIYTITDQDMIWANRMNRAYSSHQWLRREFADDLQFIWDEGTWQMHCELGKHYWQQYQTHIQGCGALGSVYPDYKWGVEGDTPSFLYVMPNGLNDPEDPRQAGWGGYHTRGISPDSLTIVWNSWQQPTRGISEGYKRRFYSDELNDFCARMQWAEEGRGNRNPQVIVNRKKGLAPICIAAKAGQTIRLDASKSKDPDGDGLTFRWWQQTEIGTTRVVIGDADKPIAAVHIPADAADGDVHLICEVHDDSPIHLVAYRRVIVNVSSRDEKGAWKLVWEDNFDSGVLDTTVWSRTTRGTADWQNTQSNDPRCLALRNGHLVLRGIINDNPNDPAEFLTGGVWTMDKKALQPGRIEVRARLQKAKGAWPAIWTMGFDHRTDPWPKGGEIDIMERLNGDSIAYQTVHSYWTYYVNGNRGTPVHGGQGRIDPSGWNVYAVDIDPDSLVFRINGTPTFTYHRVDSLVADGQYPFFRTQYLLIDMQLGGAWVGRVDPADLPVEMEIDWVRNWVRK